MSTPVDNCVDRLPLVVETRQTLWTRGPYRTPMSDRAVNVSLVVDNPRVSPSPIEVRRSARRRRTVSAYRDGDRIVVLIPQRFTRAEAGGSET